LQEKNELRELPRDDFIAQIAGFYHDLNMLHPFREGNGRTQRLFFTLLIRRAGYDINFAACDMDELMIATIYASQGVMDFLVDFFRKSIK
jgi:cell filamentation protein